MYLLLCLLLYPLVFFITSYVCFNIDEMHEEGKIYVPSDYLNIPDKSITVVNRDNEIQLDPMVVLLWSVPLNANSMNDALLHNCTSNSLINYNCLYTADRNLYNKSEAVMISMHNLSRKWSTDDVPLHRFSRQKWIFYEQEPPTHVWRLDNWKSKERYLPYRNLFNVTCLPSISADITTGPIRFDCILSPQDAFQMKFPNYALTKTKKVAWFVSHCTEPSQRDLYVKELQKYIQVDIYGKCGSLRCGEYGGYDIDCDVNLLHKKYKFYLAFENSICEEYVTEKLRRLIKNHIDVIPIVLGGIDYSTMLPRNTYIDIKDFDSPRDLAEYLSYIDGADDVFNGYIYRKRAMKCHRVPRDSVPPLSCRMCKYLHERRHDFMRAPDVTDLYGIERRCLTPQKYYNRVPGINY